MALYAPDQMFPGFDFGQPIYGGDFQGYGEEIYDPYGPCGPGPAGMCDPCGPAGGYYVEEPELIYPPDGFDPYCGPVTGGPLPYAPIVQQPDDPYTFAPPPGGISIGGGLTIKESPGGSAVFSAKRPQDVKKPPVGCYEPDPTNMKQWFGDKWCEPAPFIVKKKPGPVLSSPDQLYAKSGKAEPRPKPKWNEVVADQTSVARITEWLYLCGAAAVTPSNLKTYNITTIINATTNLQPVSLPGIKTTWVKVEDNPAANINKFFDVITQQIVDAKNSAGHVLIHCVSGISRSPTLCLAYLIKAHRMSLIDALNLVKDRRPSINPNGGFLNQLKEYETKIFGNNVTTLTAGPTHWK